MGKFLTYWQIFQQIRFNAYMLMLISLFFSHLKSGVLQVSVIHSLLFVMLDWEHVVRDWVQFGGVCRGYDIICCNFFFIGSSESGWFVWWWFYKKFGLSEMYGACNLLISKYHSLVISRFSFYFSQIAPQPPHVDYVQYLIVLLWNCLVSFLTKNSVLNPICAQMHSQFSKKFEFWGCVMQFTPLMV